MSPPEKKPTSTATRRAGGAKAPRKAAAGLAPKGPTPRGGPAPKGPGQKGPARPARAVPPPLGSGGPLVVLRDGVALGDEEAAALWRAFSAHMDEHQGDLAGFARSRGFREVRPEYRRGQAVLVIAS